MSHYSLEQNFYVTRDQTRDQAPNYRLFLILCVRFKNEIYLCRKYFKTFFRDRSDLKVAFLRASLAVVVCNYFFSRLFAVFYEDDVAEVTEIRPRVRAQDPVCVHPG